MGDLNTGYYQPSQQLLRLGQVDAFGKHWEARARKRAFARAGGSEDGSEPQPPPPKKKKKKKIK